MVYDVGEDRFVAETQREGRARHRRVAGGFALALEHGVEVVDRALRTVARFPPKGDLWNTDTLVASADGATFASRTDPVLLWTRDEGGWRARELGKRSSFASSVALSPDGVEAVRGVFLRRARARRVTVVDTRTDQDVGSIAVPRTAEGQSVDPRDVGLIAGDGVVVATREGLSLWDWAGHGLRWRQRAQVAPGEIAAAREGPIVVRESEHHLRLRDPRDGRRRGDLGVGRRALDVEGVAFDGDSLVALASDLELDDPNSGEVRLLRWSVRTGALAASEPITFSHARLMQTSGGAALIDQTAGGCPGHAIVVSTVTSRGMVESERTCAPTLAIPWMEGIYDPSTREVFVDGRDVGGLGGVLTFDDGKITRLEIPAGVMGTSSRYVVGRRVVAVLQRHAPDGHSRKGGDVVAQVWDATTGRALRTWPLGRLGSPDGDLFADAVATATDDRGELLAAAYGKELQVLALADGASRGALTFDEPITSLRFGREATLFVGTEGGSLAVMRDGRVVARGRSSTGTLRKLRVSPAGDVVASLGDDSSVGLWDARTGAQRGVFVAYRDQEWISFTPAGAYTGTGEVSDRVTWVFDHPSEAFSFEQFASRYRDPATVARRISGADVDVDRPLRRPPAVCAALEGPVTGGRAAVRVHARAVGALRAVRVIVEGRVVATRDVGGSEADVSLDFPVLPGENRVQVLAFDERGTASNPAPLDVIAGGAPARDAWVVAVGINRYPNLADGMQLGVAAQDALAITRALRSFEGGSFRRVHTRTLIDGEATVAAVRGAIEELSRMAPEDLAVVFLAGHGMKPSDDEMVFLTSAVRLAPDGGRLDPRSLRDDVVRWKDLSTSLAGAPGRVLVMLDACHSGHVAPDLAVTNDALARSLAGEKRAGVFVFAASKGREASLEPSMGRALELARSPAASLVGLDEREPHGLFTGAVLQALRSRETDLDGDGRIQLSELVDEVTRRVLDASRGAQTPWIARREMFGDLTLTDAPAAAR